MTLQDKIKQTFYHGLIYGLGEVGSKAIAFILIPLYTHNLTTAEYGIMAILTIFSTIATRFFGLGLYSALFAFYYEEKNPYQVLCTAFYMSLLGSIALICIGWLLAPFLSASIFKSTAYISYLNLIFLMAAADIIANLFLSVYRARKWSQRYGFYNCLFVVIRLLVIIYLVAFLNKGLWGILVGNTVTSWLKVVVLGLTLRQDIQISFSKKIALSMLAFGIPIVFSSLGGTILNLGDRFIINHYAAIDQVGIYNLSYQFGSIMTFLFIMPLKLIWTPMALSVRNDIDAAEYYSKMLSYSLLVSIFIALGISVNSKYLIQILAEKTYWSAYRIVPLIALSYVVWGGYEIVNIGILIHKKTTLLTLIVGSAAFINLAFNLLLVPVYGLVGAALATFLSFCIVFFLAYYFGNRFVRISYEWARISHLVFSAFVFYFVLCFWEFEDPVLSLIVKSLLLLAFPFTLYLTRFFTVDERRSIRNYLAKCHGCGVSNKFLI